MSAINLVPAALGTFMTRANRLVRINSTTTVQIPRPGGGANIDLEVYVGDLYKMDGRTVDSQHRWEKNGSFHNSRGVASDKDLCQVVKLDPPAAAAPEPESIHDGVLTDTATRSQVQPEASDELGDIKTLVGPWALGEESTYATIDRVFRMAHENPAKPARKKKAASAEGKAKKKK